MARQKNVAGARLPRMPARLLSNPQCVVTSLAVRALVSTIGLVGRGEKELDHEKFLDLFEEVEIHVTDMLIRLLTRKSLKIEKSEQGWPREQNA
jgi:hypothetical protein